MIFSLRIGFRDLPLVLERDRGLDGKNKAGLHSRRTWGENLVIKLMNQAQKYKTKNQLLKLGDRVKLQ